MNDIIILIISMTVALLGGIIAKYVSGNYRNNIISFNIFNATVSISAAVVLAFMANSFKASVFTICLALSFGAMTGGHVIFRQLALRYGSFAYTSVIISLSTLIPALSGAVIWNEKIELIQIIGMILMVVCFILSVDTKGEEKKASTKWFIFSILAFLFTGFIGVMQKWHQNTVYKGELDAFLVIAFIFSFVSSTLIAIVLSKKLQKEGKDEKKSVLALFPIALMLIAGICAALNNKYNLYLSGVMDSAVLFPILNGGGMILNLLAALVVFREKLSLRQWCGVLIGIVAVVLLCNPFG